MPAVAHRKKGVAARHKKAQCLTAVILAGGQGRRMESDTLKPLIELAGRPLIAHVIDRILPQVSAAVISINSGQDQFKTFKIPTTKDTVNDGVNGQKGPLAGILAGLDWAAKNCPKATHVVSVPADAPFIPRDLVTAMLEALPEQKGLARAKSFGRRHPVIGLWPLEIRPDLRDQLANHDVRKIDRFTSNYNIAEAEFDGIPDPFFNINTQQDLITANRILKSEASLP